MRYLTSLLFLLAPLATAQYENLPVRRAAPPPLTVVERMTCGAISGAVVDDFGEPLPGANVIIDGTRLGAAANLNGEYVIDCVPVGTYDVTASFVGFQSHTSVDVEVQQRSLHELDFELAEGQGFDCDMRIVYERPLISHDPFASRVVTGEEIERLPVGR